MIFQEYVTLILRWKVTHTNCKVEYHTNSEVKKEQYNSTCNSLAIYMYVRFFLQVLHLSPYYVFTF
jgi:hypothetical protein